MHSLVFKNQAFGDPTSDPKNNFCLPRPLLTYDDSQKQLLFIFIHIERNTNTTISSRCNLYA